MLSETQTAYVLEPCNFQNKIEPVGKSRRATFERKKDIYPQPHARIGTIE
jgi:hypothetical protein